MTETSITAYNQIKENGLLSKLRFKVYEAIVQHAPCTAGEVFKHLAHLSPGIQQHSITPRFAELQRLGVIRVQGLADCRVTGVQAICWETTDMLPGKLGKIPSKTETIKWQAGEIARLQRENSNLRDQIVALLKEPVTV